MIDKNFDTQVWLRLRLDYDVSNKIKREKVINIEEE